MAKADLTPSRLREFLHYNHETGVFTWLVSRGIKKAGAVAGIVQGYRVITIDNHPYKAHRLAWYWVYGTWPERQIDHINGNKDDNWIANLRDISMSGNMQNRYAMKRKENGLPMGVTKTARGKFNANIRIGTYTTAEEAQAAYLHAKGLFHIGYLEHRVVITPQV